MTRPHGAEASQLPGTVFSPRLPCPLFPQTRGRAWAPSPPGRVPNTAGPCPTVAINLIVQHIQDILNGGLSKRQPNGYLNGYTPARKRQASESSSRPH